MKITVVILGIVVLGLAGGAYYIYDINKKTQSELELMSNNNDELTFQVNNLEKEKAEIASELEAKISDISKEKEEGT